VKKAVKVLSTAALAATLVAPVAVTPVSAASTYTVSAVKNVVSGDWTGDGTQVINRIAVKLPSGTIPGGAGSSATMRLRLPADAYASIAGVGGNGTVVDSTAKTFTRSNGSVGAAANSVVTVTGAPTVAGTATVTVTYGGTPYNVSVDLDPAVQTDTDKTADAIVAKINADNSRPFSATKTATDTLTISEKAVNGFYSGKTIVTTVAAGTATGTAATSVNTNGTAGTVANSPSAIIPENSNGTAANSVEQVVIKPVGTESSVSGHRNAYQEFEVTVFANNQANEGLFYIDLTSIYVPSGTNGAFNVTFESADNVLSNGQISVANVGSGSVGTTIDDVNAIQNSKKQAISTIRIKEDRPGSLKGSYTLKLPKGFEWSSDSYTNARVTKVWGDGTLTTPATVSRTSDPRKLEVRFTGSTASEAAYFTISGLSVDVDDAIAEKGDVNVTVDGDSSYSNSTLLVGRYGDYNTNATAAEAPVALAGQDGQDIANITIAEEVPGSLLDGRTIKLRLTGNAKWTPTDLPKLDDALSDKQGVTVKDIKLSESDRSVVTMTVDASSRSNKKPAKLVFTKGQIDTAANASEQDVKVIIEGTAGAKGEVTVAKLKPAVTLTTEGDVPKAVIGAQEQAVADFVITEAQKGVIDDGGKKLVLHFPSGVKPTLPAKVEVTEGDLVLDTTNISKDGQDIFIPVKYDSSKPSKIKVSGVKVNVDRTVSEGDLKVEVRGDAVVTTNDKLYSSLGGSYTNYIPFENNNVAASAVVAKVVTPAAKDTTAQNIVFKLNSKTYTVDGKEFEMDAAPLVGWDRAYLPVRFAANALNVKDENIIWDDKTSTFTVFKGDRVVTGKVGDKFLTVNGVKVPMDVPVWRNKAQTNNRVMVPIRYLSNALGADIQWNQETSEITIGVK